MDEKASVEFYEVMKALSSAGIHFETIGLRLKKHAAAIQTENTKLRGLLGSLRTMVRPRGSGRLNFDCKPHMIMDRDEVLLRDIDEILDKPTPKAAELKNAMESIRPAAEACGVSPKEAAATLAETRVMGVDLAKPGGERSEYLEPDWSKAPEWAEYAYRFEAGYLKFFANCGMGPDCKVGANTPWYGSIVAIHMRPKIRDDCPVMYDYEDHEGCTGWSRFDCLPSYATNVRVLIDKDTVLKMTAWLFDLIGCCDTEPREAQAKLSAAIDRYASGENHE